MEKKLTAVILGAGSRGQTYAKAMASMPEKFEVVAVAEPLESRRNFIRDLWNLPEDKCFKDYREVLALGKIADIAVIATMDQDHLEPAMDAIRLHYDILLEKPVAPNPEDCETIAQAAEKEGVKIIVCHVLRYTPFFCTIKKLLTDGVLVIADIFQIFFNIHSGDRIQNR